MQGWLAFARMQRRNESSILPQATVAEGLWNHNEARTIYNYSLHDYERMPGIVAAFACVSAPEAYPSRSQHGKAVNFSGLRALWERVEGKGAAQRAFGGSGAEEGEAAEVQAEEELEETKGVERINCEGARDLLFIGLHDTFRWMLSFSSAAADD